MLLPHLLQPIYCRIINLLHHHICLCSNNTSTASQATAFFIVPSRLETKHRPYNGCRCKNCIKKRIWYLFACPVSRNAWKEPFRLFSTSSLSPFSILGVLKSCVLYWVPPPLLLPPPRGALRCHKASYNMALKSIWLFASSLHIPNHGILCYTFPMHFCQSIHLQDRSYIYSVSFFAKGGSIKDSISTNSILALFTIVWAIWDKYNTGML